MQEGSCDGTSTDGNRGGGLPERQLLGRSVLVIASDPLALRLESKKGPRAHRLQRQLTLKATGHPDPWGLDTRIVYDTSAALWQQGTGSSGRLARAFGAGFRRVRPAAAW